MVNASHEEIVVEEDIFRTMNIQPNLAKEKNET
jgi:hypothetical protein